MSGKSTRTLIYIVYCVNRESNSMHKGPNTSYFKLASRANTTESYKCNNWLTVNINPNRD